MKDPVSFLLYQLSSPAKFITTDSMFSFEIVSVHCASDNLKHSSIISIHQLQFLRQNSCSRRGGQLSSPGSSGALLSQRKKSKLAVTAMPFPRSSTELLSQALNDSSVMISSSYKLSKYGWFMLIYPLVNKHRP